MKLEELLQINEFTINGKEYDNDIEDAINIDPSDLQNEFTRHTKLVVTYGFAYERAEAAASEAEVNVKRAYAMLDGRVRAEFVERGIKYTEKSVENTVLISDEYVHIQNLALKARETAGLLKAAKDSMQHRLQMLLQLGNTERALIKSEPLVRYNG